MGCSGKWEWITGWPGQRKQWKDYKNFISKLIYSGFDYFLRIYDTIGNENVPLKLQISPTKFSYKLRTKFKPPSKIALYCKNGRAGYELAEQIHYKIN